MKLAELRKDDTQDLIVVKASVNANHVGAVEKEGILVEKVIRAAFEEVYEKLMKEAVVGALEKPLTLKQEAEVEPEWVVGVSSEEEEPLAVQGSSGRPTLAFDVQLAKELREQGWPLLKVAQKVGVSYSTLRRAFAGTRFNKRRRKSRAEKPKTKYVTKKLPKSKKLPKTKLPKKLRNQSKRWTAEQLSKLAAFYHDKKNHYKNGTVRGDKLGKFARALGKTPQSVGVKICDLDMSATKVYGSRRKRAPDKVSKPKGVHKRFPRLKVNVDVEVTKSVVKDMINGRALRQLDMLTIGIDDDDAWIFFVQDFIMKSKQVAEYFGVPDKFYVVRPNAGTYSVLGYKQGLFGRKKKVN